MGSNDAAPSSGVAGCNVEAKSIQESNRSTKEYERKALELKKMAEPEQSSKEHLKDEMNKLKADYNKQVNSEEEQKAVHMNVVRFS